MEHLSQFITHHWQLWLLFTAILILTFLNELFIKNKKAKELSPQALVDLINQENAVVIDIRDLESFKKGHIIGSIHAVPADLNQKKMDKYKNKSIVLVCTRGIQASTLASTLGTKECEPIVLSGGITAWVNADLPLIKGK